MNPDLAPAVRAQLQDRNLPADAAVVMRQRWVHLLFLHWRVPTELVARTLPPGLEPDLWDGDAWVGIVPFGMRAVRPRGVPALPWVSSFLELNLRTYVRDAQGRAGVWFYSLDANNPLAVAVARAGFALPYHCASMGLEVTDGECRYRSRRVGTAETLTYRYEPVPPWREAQPGSLDFFLVERYRLFARRRDRLLSGRVYHPPYRLAEVEVAEQDPRLFALDGLPVPPGPPDHQAYAAAVDVSIYGMRPA